MTAKQVAYLLIGLGAIVLLSTWGHVADWTEKTLKGEDESRSEEVVYWTSSGSPQNELKRARQFEQLNPSVNIDPNFRQTGGLQDILFVSFLSGNPPDYMSVKANEIRNFVEIGGIYPLDELVEAENEQLLRTEGSTYYDQYLLGKARVYRFTVNPDDRFLREMEKYPLEAARLLHMHGKIVGLRDMPSPDTLTYNKRIFREAARMFPEAGLVDENNEPIPPATWLELYEKARVISEYGRRVAEQRGLPAPLTYGVVIQGQDKRDIMRGIKPLARRAGTDAFAFQGDTRTVLEHLKKNTRADADLIGKYENRPIGYFDYDHPSYLAAFAMLKKLRADDLVLPGTKARGYEQARTALAQGDAAMLIDGYHAALIGAERVPWAAEDLGSAPVPKPYHAPEQGRSPEQIEAEKDKLHELLALEALGIELPPGNKLPWTAKEEIQFFTSTVRSPQATWDWIHFTTSSEEILKAACRRGTVQYVAEARQHLDDPEWFPYPYQKQVYDVIENHSTLWPEKPMHGPVGETDQDIFHKYFYTDFGGDGPADLADMLKKARKELKEVSEKANRDLARRIIDGELAPGDWTFPQWDPTDGEKFYFQQQAGSQDPGVAARIEQRKAELAELARKHPELDLLGEDGTIAEDIWTYRAPNTAWQALWIPGMMLLVIAIYLGLRAVGDLRKGQPLLRETFRSISLGRAAYLFILPGMVLLFAFAIYPAIYQFFLAAHSGDGLGQMRYVGWENFDRLLNPWSERFDEVFWKKVVPNTLLFMVVVTAGQITIGMVFANMLNLPLRGNKVYRVLYFIPLVTSLAIVSVILLGLLAGEKSGINQFLQEMGWQNIPYYLGMGKGPGDMPDLTGKEYGLWTVMGVVIWHGLPYNIILLLAGLQAISPTLYEAARVDGTNALQRFWHVTIPEIIPILIIITFNAFIGAARAFSAPFILTQGGAEHSSELVSTYVFKKGFLKPEGQVPDLGYAAALGVIYSVLLAVLTLTNVIIIARRWKRRLATEQKVGQKDKAELGVETEVLGA